MRTRIKGDDDDDDGADGASGVGSEGADHIGSGGHVEHDEARGGHRDHALRKEAEVQGPGEPEISGCFIPSASDRAFLTRVTKQTGIDQVFKTFDVDDAAGPHIGLMLIRNEGDAVVLYDACRLWSPAGEARAVLVPTGTQDFGHFAYRRQAAMRHVAGLPARDLEAGFRRADRRYATLLQSAAVQAAGRECWIHVLGSTGGTVTSRCKPATSS